MRKEQFQRREIVREKLKAYVDDRMLGGAKTVTSGEIAEAIYGALPKGPTADQLRHRQVQIEAIEDQFRWLIRASADDGMALTTTDRLGGINIGGASHVTGGVTLVGSEISLRKMDYEDRRVNGMGMARERRLRIALTRGQMTLDEFKDVKELTVGPRSLPPSNSADAG